MNKKKILALLDKKTEARQKLVEVVKNTQDIEELRTTTKDIEELDAEINELRSIVDSIDDEERGEHFVPDGERTPNPMDLRSISKSENRSAENSDMEERQAFMKYVLTGEKSELRDAQVSSTKDAGVTIPNTVLDRIVEKMRSYGNIFSRVTVTNVKGGVTIPTKSVKPTASWVTEGKTADSQKSEVDGKITFAYHKLQIKVAVTLEASVTSLPIFEDNIVQNCYEAMIIAIEDAIINGSGTSQPLGITKDSAIKGNQKISVKPSEIGKYETWAKIFSKIPLSKRSGVVLILNNETYEGDLMGMTDSQGQPVARVNMGLNGEDKPVFKGKEVIEVESALPSFETCTKNNVFGIIVDLKDYMINSNLAMTVKRYFDENTDQDITKYTMILDGKLADSQGVLLLTKADEA